MNMLYKNEIKSTNKTSKKIILSSFPQDSRVSLLEEEEEKEEGQKDKKNFWHPSIPNLVLKSMRIREDQLKIN
jgi:hypothetical protein